MTKNDTFIKILFAIEVALLPMVICAHIVDFMPVLTMSLFIATILICKVWAMFLKNKQNKMHTIINSIGNILIFTVLLIYFCCVGLIHVALAVVTIICVWLTNLFEMLLSNKYKAESINIVRTCYKLFEILALLALIFILENALLTTIALFGIILTAVVLIVYSIVFIFKYTDYLKGIKKIFKRK